jgi:putative flippase GtrA
MIKFRIIGQYRMHKSVLTLIRFCIFSGASFSGNFGLMWWLHGILSLPAWLSFPIALVLVSLLNFVSLRYFVFKGVDRPAEKQAAIFFPAVAAFRLAEYLVFLFFVDQLEVDYQLTMAIVLPTSAVGKYVAFNKTFA